MSDISDEIVDLIIKKRLKDLKENKSRLSEEEYKQSEYNIVSSRDNDSLDLEALFNQIDDKEVFSKVINKLRDDISKGNIYTDNNGKLNIESIREKIIEKVQDGENIENNSVKDRANNEIKDTIISVALIDKMNKDFKSLTDSEIRKLLDNYTQLSYENRRNFSGKLFEKLNGDVPECGKGILEDNETEQKNLQDYEDILIEYKKYIEGGNQENLKILLDIAKRHGMSKQTFTELYEEYGDNRNNIINAQGKNLNSATIKVKIMTILNKSDEKGLSDEEKKILEEHPEEVIKCKKQIEMNIERNKLIDINTSLENKKTLSGDDKKFLEDILKNTVDEPSKIENIRMMLRQSDLITKLNRKETLTEEEKSSFEKYHEDVIRGINGNFDLITIYNGSIYENENPSMLQIDNKGEDTISQENKSAYGLEFTEKILVESDLQEKQQIPVALSKSNFSPEDIQEALKQYKAYFEKLEDDDIEYLSELSNDELGKVLINEFEEIETNDNSKTILKMMSQLTYGGKFQQILTNPEMRTNFLQQFDQVIEQGINPEQNVQLDGELAQVLSQYFKDNAVDMDVSLIEEAQKQSQEQQQEGQEESRTETTISDLENQSKIQKEPTVKDESQSTPKVEDTLQSTPQIEELVAENSNAFEKPENQNIDNALEVQDNTFIGKLKRLAGLMRNKKENDKSQGFFSRLRSSVKEVFGNKNPYEVQEDFETTDTLHGQATDQTQTSNDFVQRVNVNSLEAVAQTRANQVAKAKAKANLEIEDNSMDDLIQ
jgi:hypothetical protein